MLAILIAQGLAHCTLSWTSLTPASFPDKASSSIEAFLSDCAAFGWSGAVHLQRGSKTVFSGAFGLADDASARPLEVDTLIDVGTLTQSLTTVAMLALVDEGKLSLTEPLTTYVPGAPEYAGKITLAHLSRGTSGFKGSVSVSAEDSRDEALVKLLEGTPKSAPGEAYAPWRAGFVLLAGVVERASGRGFEDYLREALFERSKVSEIAFIGDEVDVEREALGHESGRTRRASEPPLGGYGWKNRGASGLLVSAPDLAKLLVALQGGKLLGKDTAAAMARRGPSDRGLGWGIDWDYQADCGRLEAEGASQGFRSFASVNLGTKLVTVVLSNRSDCPARFMDTIVRDMASGEKLLTKQSIYPPSTVKWSSKDLDALVGLWTDADGTELAIERYGKGSLLVEAYRVALSEGTRDPKRAVFAPVAKRELVNHAWVPGAKLSQLEWNGKRGTKGVLTLTDPRGKRWALTLVE